ncbi:MAG TPA: MFS transporter, partial [Planctomycetaceae bacterium]|nr:MFS transporter [Planctomycetaceae bacterium]
EEMKQISEKSTQAALASMAYFPGFMLACYIILIFYFKTQGGYKAQVIAGHKAEDEKFTGGVAGAVE